MMTLDNGSAYGQADPHSIALGREERIEQLVHVSIIEACSGSLHTQAHPVLRMRFGFDYQLPWTIFDRAHRLESVAQQVQDNLLQLDTIAAHGWQILGKLRSQNHP